MAVKYKKGTAKFKTKKVKNGTVDYNNSTAASFSKISNATTITSEVSVTENCSSDNVSNTKYGWAKEKVHPLLGWLAFGGVVGIFLLITIILASTYIGLS